MLKAMLTREQADAIKFVKEKGTYKNRPEGENAAMVWVHAQPTRHWNLPELNELSMETLIRALYIGYEIGGINTDDE
jgi:hypothetical protein